MDSVVFSEKGFLQMILVLKLSSNHRVGKTSLRFYLISGRGTSFIQDHVCRWKRNKNKKRQWQWQWQAELQLWWQDQFYCRNCNQHQFGPVCRGTFIYPQKYCPNLRASSKNIKNIASSKNISLFSESTLLLKEWTGTSFYLCMFAVKWISFLSKKNARNRDWLAGLVCSLDNFSSW